MIQMHEVPPIVQLKDVFPAPRCMLMIMVKSSASDAQFLSFSTASGVQFNLTVAVISVFLHLLHLCVYVFSADSDVWSPYWAPSGLRDE